MSDIFISYASEDIKIAEQYVQALESRGYSVWWDDHLHAGLPFVEGITKALNNAHCIMVLWSTHSVEKDWVLSEASKGKKREVLLPVLVKNVELPLPFDQLHTVKMVDWDGDPADDLFKKLVNKIAKNMGSAKSSERGEYILPQQDRLINTIDHTDQIDPMTKDNESDRGLFWFKAQFEDWPKAFADHVYFKTVKNVNPIESLVVEMSPSPANNDAFWDSLVRKKISNYNPKEFTKEQAQEEIVKQINLGDLVVIYTPISIDQHLRHLPRFVDDACKAIEALPPFAPDRQLIVLFACFSGPRQAKFWPLKRKFKLKLPAKCQCTRLPPLRKLKLFDTEKWLTEEFDDEHSKRYDKDYLRTEMGALFKQEGNELDYLTVRKRLMDDRVLERARRE